MAHQDASRHVAQSPAVAALKYDAGVGPEPHKVMMERSFSQDIQEGTKELKEAAEQTRNIILDLSLDGIIRWVSPSWTDVIGTSLESIKGNPISKHIHDDPDVFRKAIDELKSNDSKSQFVKFTVLAKSSSDLAPLLQAQQEERKSTDGSDSDQASQEALPLQLEGQGIMVYDRTTGGESHTMWMLQPAAEPIQIEIELPQILVDTLGVGAEILAKYLSELAESGANDPANHPPPLPVACRICERSIVPWWFERHSDLCVQEHKAEMDVQMLHEALSEHRHAIVKVLDAFEARSSRSVSGENTPQPLPEYKGLPIGPSPSSSSAVSSKAGSKAASPARSPSPSLSGLGHARSRSSFIVRRPMVRIVELILDLCDTAIEINVPAIKESKPESDEDFRTQSPQSESRINQVLHWQQPSSLENEPGLAALSVDTEKLARAKVEAVHRHQVILEYSERIRQEYLAEVDACISEALFKAERAAAGEPISSSESEEEDDLQLEDIDEGLTPGAEEPTPVVESEPELTRSRSRPTLRSMASALRNPLELPPVYLQERRSSSQAVSTGSNSPQECPTPKSTKGNILSQPQPINKRRSIYATTEDGENSDSSLPSSSALSSAWRPDSPASVPDTSLHRSASSRDRKRRSMHLHGLSSSSPHRNQSPGRYPPPPASPLRMTKGRLPSVDASAAGGFPIVSPLITTNDFPSSPHYHHRRQSSMHSSDARAPLSPRLSSVAHPLPRAQPPSIKDFEIVKPISKGAFGSVYLSKKKLTGEYFAIKVLRKSDMVAKNQVTNVKAERAIMMWQGESDFVAKLYWTFSSKDHLFLVMEYLNGGDCASLVKILGGLTEDWAKKYIAEVVLGVEHLHSRGIVHRDLKPDNLLIDSKGHLKLTDFGLSRMGLIGRQKRALKSTDEPVPDLFKQESLNAQQVSGPPSRSASFDFPPGSSPGQTPLMTPSLAGGLDQPSYFNLNRESSLSRELSRRTSGHRSDSGSMSSHDLQHAFQGLGINDSSENNKILPGSQRHGPIEEESGSQGSGSPDLYPLSQSMSNISQLPSATASQMLPPPTALFDPEENTKRFVGTPDYLAPETINGTVQDEMCDWWSLGCILFEFLYGIPPFNAPTTEQVFDNILNRRIAWPDEDEYPVTEEAKDLINKLIQVDPRKRLGANVDEKYSSGGAEIQAHAWFAEINWETLLEDEAQFVPNPENPEDTEYFDTRGATLQAFPEELEETSPAGPIHTTHDYTDRPHDALFRARTQATGLKRGLMPLHIPPHIARDSRSRRLSEPVIADDFGNFTFKNLPVLEKANKDILEKMRKEALQAQARSAQGISQSATTSNTPSILSPAPSVEGSPMVPMPVKRALSVSKHHRPASPSPSGFSGAAPSPSRSSQPASPLLVQFSTGNHERRKTSGSSNTSSQHDLSRDSTRNSATSSPVKRMANMVPPISTKPGSGSPQSTTPGRTRSQTVGSQDSESHLAREPFIPGHHKRRSQLFVRDVSPSSSDNENFAHAKAYLKVARKRQSSRRLSQFNIESPAYRPLDILICEDHPVSKMVMEKLFEKLRCRTITASTGPDSLRLAVSQIPFDIIFMEFKLPLINGVDVARMVRDTKSANTTTPIVCMTGYLKDLPDAHQFDTLLQKPPTLTKLTEALCKYCSWKPPPKDYKPHVPLSIPAPALPLHNLQDSPSSVASSRAPTMPESSYKGSSREDSISSGGFFSDLESLKADDMPFIISRPMTDEWGKTGLGIMDEPAADSNINTSEFPPLMHVETAPALVSTESSNTLSAHHIKPKRSTEAIRTKRESIEKSRKSLGGAEEGDDEDEELGHQSRQRSPINRTVRASSKLGHEMLRTNSRGSVISLHDDRTPEPENLRKSLEILEERMEGLRIPEEDALSPSYDQPWGATDLASQRSHHESVDRPGSRGHITPPEIFPMRPGSTIKDVEIDNTATPMPIKTIDFAEDATPKPYHLSREKPTF